MQIILELDETWSLMSTITSYLIDNSGVSQDGKQAVRRWRTDRASGTVEMDHRATLRRWRSEGMKAGSDGTKELTAKINADIDRALKSKEKSAIMKPDWR